MSARGRPKSNAGGGSGADGEDGALLEEVMQHEEVQNCLRNENKWSSRVLLVSQQISGCTFALQEFTAAVEKGVADLYTIEEEANCLIKMNLSEFKIKRERNYNEYLKDKEGLSGRSKPTSAAGRRASKKASSRPTSSRSERVSLFADADATGELMDGEAQKKEQLFAALDAAAKSLPEERKLQKISHLLSTFYHSDCAEELKPLLVKAPREPTDPLIEGEEGHPTDTSIEDGEARSSTSEGASISFLLGQFISTESPTKPKDVPAVVWEELCQLRAKRLYFEINELVPFTEKVRQQSQRARLLEENYNLAAYALEAATRELEKKKESVKEQLRKERAVREAQEALQKETSDSKNRSSSAKSKKKK